ncbi:HAMP domain-containing sensor histidine kinase [Aminobacter aminovorans]|uniref:sensor histidine kinase n=1 Tax=Aminobacter aminovorans TaxID=83263 RepID=UPI002856EBC5|nr:HAMP domain-containing sensor histidine kinase [Aminobacter aminovorans]MDR7224287.1 signal transduction histidine kinase [Aminobacter aminovorans]
MKTLLRRLVPQSLRVQLMAIILVAMLVVIVIGSAFERITNSGYVPDMEIVAERAGVVAALLRQAPAEERAVILKAAKDAGLDFRLLSLEQLAGTSSPQQRTTMGRIINTLFPPDREPPLGGRWLMISDQPALVFTLDQGTAAALFGAPDTLLTSQFVSPATYYLLALVVLFVLFSFFAVWAVTDPLKRISAAVGSAELDNDDELFVERGSIEMVGLARALNTMRARIRTMIDNRTRMLRSVSHDLRTPLTRLRLRAERMDDGVLRGAMLSDIGHIEGLIDETLTYLRHDVSTEELQRADIASVLQTVCAEFTDVGFSVSYTGPDRLPGWCKPNALARAITNLCDNGVKFAPNVKVVLTATDEAALIEVIDNGPGIPETVRARVFEPFYKVDASRGANAKRGFGLGLSIVADIVHGHGGIIELDDNRPTGLVVKVDLPRGLVAAQAMP